MTPAEQYAAILGKPKPSKYRNIKTVVDGLAFDSKKEAKRWGELNALQRADEIYGLRRQHVFPLDVNGHSIARYVADFIYFTKEGRGVVEDVKSPITRRNPVYRLKRALMAAIHGIEVTEV